jgi:UDP-3-O-[3-hydroxymyristoyl] glucosamine N-acyltransferase
MNTIETKKIGKNLIVDDFSIIRENVSLGDNVIVREHCIIGSNPIILRLVDDPEVLTHKFGVKIGSDVFIGAFTNINCGMIQDTIIEDDVIINSYVLIAENCHIYRGVDLAPGVKVGGNTSIGENTVVGLGAMIRNRIKIGSNCLIGMGAVVVKDIPDNVIAYGNPCVVHDKNTVPTKAVRKIVREVKKVFE